MTDAAKIIFTADLPGEEGRHIRVTAESEFGEVVTVTISDNHGEFAFYLHDPDEVAWLGKALADAWAALPRAPGQPSPARSRDEA